MLAGLLPSRWWPSLDRYFPVTDSAMLGAIATILAAAAIGVPGFVHHVSEQVASNNQLLLDAAARPENASVPESDWGRMFWGASGLSLFTFIVLTPAGWASSYLGVSGLWRAIASGLDEPFGDPILTGLDALLLRGIRDSRATVARVQRESLEGPEMPDRLMSAEQLGVADADFVVAASRRKPDWDRGTVLITEDGTSYRVGTIEERMIAGHLRTLYPLKEHKDFEVFRRVVRYDLPPGRAKGEASRVKGQG
jgi:hypothetical protein